MARFTLPLVLLLAASAPAAAQPAPGTQPLTHESLWLMKRVGQPVVSPDGRWAVFPVTEPAYDEKKEVQDLWIVPVDGSAGPRRLTGGRAGETAPSWSADSRRLAFVAKRDDDEVAQVYVLDLVGGGEAQRLTASPLAARTPRFSPDGRWIAYQSAVYEGATDLESNRRLVAAKKEAKSKVRAYETFPIRHWDRWLDETRTHVFTIATDGSGSARDLLAGTRLAAEPGFGGAAGETSGDDLRPAWAKDGRSLVIVASTNRTDAAHSPTNTHLYQLPLGGGEPAPLTSGHTSEDAPRFAPDGRTLCYRAGEEWGRIYAIDRLACAAWPWTGAGKVITAGFDRSVADFAYDPASPVVYLTAEDQGFVRLYSVPLSGGPVTPVLESRGAFSSIETPERASAPVIVASWGSATEPPEIVRVDPVARTRVRLTELDVAAAAALPWQPLQEFSFTGARGRRIHSFVALPPGFDPARKYPLLVLIHGGHANMWRDSISLRWNYHLLASPGYVVLLTDYRGSTGYGEAFTLDILGDPLRGPAFDINRAADEAIRRYPFIDATRQAAGGASYGGHLANWLEASTGRYRCLISHAGLASLTSQWATSDSIFHRELMMGAPFWEKPEAWRDQSPVAYAKSFKTPMLLSVGENDYRVPANNTLEMYAVLSRMKVPTRLLVWPDENHWIQKGENSRVFYQEVRDWLARWLK
ncbi:MAG TPA: S9 family peptidase [Vicinamibacteria bacterium]|nr:S9 family peptidase [Vicinamibacteria bacterium]